MEAKRRVGHRGVLWAANSDRLLSASAVCAEPPDTPIPNGKSFTTNSDIRTEPAVKFFDKGNEIEAAAMLPEFTDMAQTCYFLSHGAREFNLTQSCPANVAITLGFDAAAIMGAYLLHRTHHSKLAR